MCHREKPYRSRSAWYVRTSRAWSAATQSGPRSSKDRPPTRYHGYRVDVRVGHQAHGCCSEEANREEAQGLVRSIPHVVHYDKQHRIRVWHTKAIHAGLGKETGSKS